MSVERWDEARDGALDERALARKLAERGYRVTRHVYPPGTVFGMHHHDVDKMDAVLSGRLCVVLRGDAVVLEAGDAIHVPRGAPHTAEVVGDEPVVSLDGTRDPGWP